MNIFTALLQNRTQFVKEIQESVNLRKKIIQLLITSVIAFGVYGFIIGLSHSFAQGLSSMLKLPVLYILTLSICVPAFFIFSSLFGSKKNFLQSFALAMTATTVISMLLAGFAPVTLFFLITTDNYQFFKLLNVVFFIISGAVGARMFYQFIKSSSDGDEHKFSSQVWLIRSWIVLYAFVGSQLGWTLRPFFREHDQKFVAFQEVKGNFYSNVFKSLGSVFGSEEKINASEKKEREAKSDDNSDHIRNY